MIALSSIAGMIGSPTLSPYIASKHAVYGLVKTSALELGAFNIRVNAIGPGPIDNRMIRSIETQLSPDDPDTMREGFSQLIAMKRYGTNEEVANLISCIRDGCSHVSKVCQIIASRSQLFG